ncbi:hypothetical protein ACFOHS_00155 [Jhaorihella thermophila]
MLSPLPEGELRAFFDDCKVVLVPELNYQGPVRQSGFRRDRAAGGAAEPDHRHADAGGRDPVRGAPAGGGSE